MNKLSRNQYHLKEQVVHGTPQLPVSVFHLSYGPDVENYFQLHWHDEIELLVVLKGTILYTLDHEDIVVSAGEGLFINTDRIHGARPFGGKGCEACVLVFHPLLLSQDLNSGSYGRFVYPVLHNVRSVPSKWSPDIHWQHEALGILASLDELHGELLTSSELLVKGRLLQLWHIVFHNGSSSGNEDGDFGEKAFSYKIERIKRVLAFMHNHYPDDLSLDDLAAIVPMSKSQFCRSFKEIIGVSPMAYLINYRIEESCQRLMESDRNIAGIARDAGFNTISYFNREFLKRMGCSPSLYRKERK